MKQKIVVPTDFSNNALTAARYALELAKTIDADIHILHAYRAFTSSFQSKSANETDEKRAELEASKGLEEFKEKLGAPSDVQISYSVKKNNLLDAIRKYTNANPTRLILMGTYGASGSRTELLGSNTYDVAKNIDLPLLVIPEDVEGFALNKVVFFSDYQKDDVKTLSGFKSLFDHVDPSCTLVHIHEGKTAPTQEAQQKLQQWQTTLQQDTSFNKLSAELVHAREGVDVVNRTIDQLKADFTLLTLVNGKSFFDRLLHKSLARAIVLNPKTPVLLVATS